jgi:hypothetical protein
VLWDNIGASRVRPLDVPSYGYLESPGTPGAFFYWSSCPRPNVELAVIEQREFELPEAHPPSDGDGSSPHKRRKSGHFLTAASCHNRTYAQHDFHFALVVPVLVRCRELVGGPICLLMRTTRFRPPIFGSLQLPKQLILDRQSTLLGSARRYSTASQNRVRVHARIATRSR